MIKYPSQEGLWEPHLLITRQASTVLWEFKYSLSHIPLTTNGNSSKIFLDQAALVNCLDQVACFGFFLHAYRIIFALPHTLTSARF